MLNTTFQRPTLSGSGTRTSSLYILTPAGHYSSSTKNLEQLLDKAIVRVVTKGEDLVERKISRTAEMIKYCTLRNIQLDHSRTIITIFMRMLTTKDIDVEAVATRLLEQLPQKLEKQSQSYTKMIKYLEHLAKGSERRVNDDLVAASVYTKRSAAFSELKTKVSEACESNDWANVRKYCQELVDKHAETAALWHVKPDSLKIQNMKAYKDLLDTDLRDDVDQATKTKIHELTRQVLSDAEKRRVPWHLGNHGRFGDDIEPLNEAFLHEILTGEKPKSLVIIGSDDKSATATTTMVEKKTEDEFTPFKSSLQASFITTMQQNLSAEDVCGIIKVPVPAMRGFHTSSQSGLCMGALGREL